MNGQARAKILLVDDRPENLFALKQVLDCLDVQIDTASSGNEALVKMIHEDFFLVLLDVHMPDMDGIEVANLMQNRPETRDTPIIFITAANQGARDEIKGYAAGAVDFLTTPIDHDVLKCKVSVFLQLYRKQQKLEQEIMACGPTVGEAKRDGLLQRSS